MSHFTTVPLDCLAPRAHSTWNWDMNRFIARRTFHESQVTSLRASLDGLRPSRMRDAVVKSLAEHEDLADRWNIQVAQHLGQHPCCLR